MTKEPCSCALDQTTGAIIGDPCSACTTDQLPSKEMTIDEALQEIQRLREDLARAESAHAAVMAENAYYKAELACVARVMDDAVLGLRQLRDFANQQWESVQRRMLSNAQTDSDDWCPSCTKPYAECRCNGVQL